MLPRERCAASPRHNLREGEGGRAARGAGCSLVLLSGCLHSCPTPAPELAKDLRVSLPYPPPPPVTSARAWHRGASPLAEKAGPHSSGV